MSNRKTSKSKWSDYGLTATCWSQMRPTQPDRHNEIELNFLDKGNLTYLFNGRPFHLTPGKLTVFWAVIPHQIVHCEDSSNLYWASVPLAWFLQWNMPEALTQPILNGDIVTANTSKNEASNDLALIQQWVNDSQHNDPEDRKIIMLEAEARLRRLCQSFKVTSFSKHQADSTGMILTDKRCNKAAKMAGFIVQNYTSDLKIDQIAASVGLHPNYATTLFRKAFGVSLINYLNQSRVSHAERLLTITDEKILSIAMDSGFSTLSWFNNIFQRLTGRSPKAYRDFFR